MMNANTRASAIGGQNGGVSIALGSGITFDNVRRTFGTTPLTGSGYGMTYASSYDVQMVTAPSMYWHTSSTIISNATDTGPMYNLLDDPATTGKISVGSFGLNKDYNGVVTTGTAFLDNAGHIFFPSNADTAVITSKLPIKGITSFQNIAPTIQSVNPTYLSYTFRVKTPTGPWSTSATLDGTNLSTAISSLSGYNSNVGFHLEVTATATFGPTLQTRLDFIWLKTNTDTTYVANDAYLDTSGANATDIVECRLISDDSLIGSAVGSARLYFPASGNYGVTAYLVRKTSTGTEIMRTQNDPFTIKYGNNGTFYIYSGNEVQLADASDYVTAPDYPNYLDLGGILKPL
jgi:hypothetical protein